jgi:hypothetical protein
MILWSGASYAEGALAVGLPSNSPRNGFAYGVAFNQTVDEAPSKALSDCRGVDVRDTSKARAACKVIETFRNQCVNISLNGDRNTPSSAVGWGIGPDTATANSRAQTMCETMRAGKGRECHLDGEPVCDGDAK